VIGSPDPHLHAERVEREPLLLRGGRARCPTSGCSRAVRAEHRRTLGIVHFTAEPKKKLSLRPITLEEAVEAVVQVEPPPKEEKRPVSSTGVGLAD
jgi:hypothetical protein